MQKDLECFFLHSFSGRILGTLRNLKIQLAISSTLIALFWLAAAVSAADTNTISGWKLLNLDMDRSVSSQKKLEALLDDSKDLHASVNAIRLWANSKGLKIIRKAIAEMRSKYPKDKWLTFMGSGDFHQTAATLIETLPESAKPVTIILFDNHPDWFKAPAHYHCGAWVVQALKHSWVEKVIMIGQNSADLRGDQFRFAPFNELCKGRVELHPLLREKSFVPLVWRTKVAGVESCKRNFLGTELRFSTLRGLGLKALGDRLAGELAGKNVYISIDKDVLDTQYAITDWDQGQLSLDELTNLIGRFADSSNLVGMDICGERAPDPINGLIKNLDAHRIHRKIKNFDQANDVNQKTNLEIVRVLRESAFINKSVSGTIERKRN